MGGTSMNELSAGGIVYRFVAGKPELLLIEDRFRRVTFAKGRVEPGEDLPATALRETKEETGITGRISHALGEICYQYYDPKRGRINKTVQYYLIEAQTGLLQPQTEEINSVKWCPLERALQIHEQRGYANNSALLDKAAKIVKELAGNEG
jgi:8-oxo-dGTP pyrophosphatase MutT (NUDIX family)